MYYTHVWTKNELLAIIAILGFTGTGVGGRINTRLRLSLTDPLKETLLRILFCLPDGWDGAISSVPKNWWCTELVHLIRSYSNGYTNIHIYLYIPVHVHAYIFFLITPACTTQLMTDSSCKDRLFPIASYPFLNYYKYMPNLNCNSDSSLTLFLILHSN